MYFEDFVRLERYSLSFSTVNVFVIFFVRIYTLKNDFKNVAFFSVYIGHILIRFKKFFVSYYSVYDDKFQRFIIPTLILIAQHCMIFCFPIFCDFRFCSPSLSICVYEQPCLWPFSYYPHSNYVLDEQKKKKA